ncbi:hypothetical protein S245_034480 [Arachis hypogaea]
MPLNIDDWRCYDKEEKNKLLKIVRKRTQANRINRTKQKMPHMEGSKSIATLMDEQELIEEKLNNDELSNEESNNGVAWEGDIYSQVLGSDTSGYVRGLGLGPTPSLL